MRHKHRIIAWLVFFCLLFTMMPVGGMTAFAVDGVLSGDGSSVTPYQISDASDLLAFAELVNNENVNAYAVLTDDIDMEGETWAGIATGNPYTGTFDGQGYTISNLTGTEGLFKNNDGIVRNVRLTDVNISRDGGNLGAVVGLNTGTVSGCVTSGSVSGTGSSSWSIGGISGWNNKGTVSGCVSSCTVSSEASGNQTAGGLVGSNSGGGIIISSIYIGTAARPVEGDSTHGTKTDVYYKDTNGTWHKVTGNGSSTTDSTIEEAMSVFNEYVTENGGYFLLTKDGNIQENVVFYLDYAETEQSLVRKSCQEYTLLTESYLTDNGYTLQTGWYVVGSDIVSSDRITISGDVHLILADGSHLTANGGVQCGEGNSLTIYGQEESTGALTSQNVSSRNAGIGGGDQEAAGTITINGGNITANGSSGAAGIGGGGGYRTQTQIVGGVIVWGSIYPGGAGGEITINGGTVTANGSSGAAGIGGGWYASGGVITINGGSVTAQAEAHEGEPAAIGGGGGDGSAGTIKITGGIVSATGCGKGIGGGSGQGKEEGMISISGGAVTANGVGSGNYGESIGTSITGNAVVISTGPVNTSNQNFWHGIIFENSVGYVYGDSVTITESCTLFGDVQLTVEANQTVTISEDVTLTLERGCTLTLDQVTSIVNNGTIIDKGADITVDGILHNHDVSSGYVYEVSERSGYHLKSINCIDCPIANADDHILYIGEEACSGGMATCVKQAMCQYCGQPYGEVNLANHVSFDDNGFCSDCGGYQPAVYNSESGYYEISNIGQLFWFAGLVNGNLEDGTEQNTRANGRLIADINLSGYNWFPIGQYSDNSDAIPAENHYTNSEYHGIFDGNFHVISNLTVSMEYPYESGLFGRVSGGTVRNLGIENASIISTATLSDGASGVRVGVIAGENTTGTIENCYTAGTIVLENKEGGQRGGIAGETASGTIRNSFTTYEALTAAGHSETIINSYANSDLTDGQLASGELAWLLNEKTQGGTTWRQTIGTDEYPNFRTDSALVYASTCLGGGYAFCNNEADAEAYHLKDTSSSYTQVIGDMLTLSADVQNESGQSADQAVSYQWYQKQEVLTSAPTDIDANEWDENNGVYTSMEYTHMLNVIFTVSEDGKAIGFEYLLSQGGESELMYDIVGLDNDYLDYGRIMNSESDGVWQKMVFEDLPAGRYRLFLSLFQYSNSSTTSIKLQTTYEGYQKIEGATEKTYTVPTATETGIYDYMVEASFQDSSEQVEMSVSVVGPTYYVTIPTQAAAGESFTVRVDAELISRTQELIVTVSGTSGENDAFTLQSEEGAVLRYSLKNGNTVLAIGDRVLSVKNGETDSAQFTVQPDAPRYAGIYTGELIFTISVEEVSSQ